MSALQAQQPLQSHRIAIVASALPSDMTEVGHSPFFRVFSAELRRLGYIEGHNLIFERYSTWGLKEPFSEVAASVVRQNPDLILAIGSRVVRALKLATTVIPIVGVMSDPVAFGIVKSEPDQVAILQAYLRMLALNCQGSNSTSSKSTSDSLVS